MYFIDTHCHLYLNEFAEDRKEVVKRALDNNVKKILLPAIHKERQLDLQRCYNENSNYCLPMAGLHPCYVKENYKEELDFVKQCLNHDKSFIAVGEIGLDFYHDIKFKKEQLISFNTQLHWAIEQGLPVSMHCRQALNEAMEIVKPLVGKGLKGVFHCFSGTIEQAKEIASWGMYLGIGGVISYKNTNLREIIKQIDLKNILLETDAPYLAPIPFRSKRNEPSWLINVAEILAIELGLEINSVAEITTNNALQLFKL